ncbi:50S ribosomal protein L25 [Candidatus Kaiserbacteria bacterium]|nr:50S ribosomal protein L25 [Candidatus Kaiserbacteria bacterium]MCB9811725.1 50S ribosomal protein L25 [Candidatus Nomurabacteria bacterium]
MTTTLQVTKRDGTASPECIPAVVYGPKQESLALNIDRKTFEKLFKEAGESTIISLEGLDGEVEVLVHDVSFNPVRGGIQHVDFYAIERGKELTTHVGIEFIGEAPAVKGGGVLNKALHELEVTCRPSKLPQHITVDVSVLTDFEEVIRVKDISLPEGVKVENDPNETVALVVPVAEEKEEDAAPVDMAAIEVEGEKTTSEDGEGKEAE